MDTSLNTAVMVRSDARAIGMVTAFRTGGTRRAPRTTAREITSECVSYMSDGTRSIVGSVRHGNRKRYDRIVADVVKISDARLHARIGNQSQYD